MENAVANIKTEVVKAKLINKLRMGSLGEFLGIAARDSVGCLILWVFISCRFTGGIPPRRNQATGTGPNL